MISGKCGLDAALLGVQCRDLKELLEVPIDDLQFFALISPQLHSTLREIRPNDVRIDVYRVLPLLGVQSSP